MTSAACGQRIQFKHVLFLTDFSEPSCEALPFAAGIARAYGSVVHAVHVLLPTAYAYMTPDMGTAVLDAQEEAAKDEMARVDAKMMGLPHDSTIERGGSLWEVVERQLAERHIDLVVLGTHGRTGFKKALLGSSAEEVFRRTPVPVLLQGPAARVGAHGGGRFRCVLFATDFNAVSAAAGWYAVSLAQENQARLILLHILPHPKGSRESRLAEASVAEKLHRLEQLVPQDAELWCRPQPFVEHGAPAQQILGAARRHGADLIVLGIRGVDAIGEMATRVAKDISYDVVAHATCPVLTVRGKS